MALVALELFPLHFLLLSLGWGKPPVSCGRNPSSKCVLSMLREKGRLPSGHGVILRDRPRVTPGTRGPVSQEPTTPDVQRGPSLPLCLVPWALVRPPSGHGVNTSWGPPGFLSQTCSFSAHAGSQMGFLPSPLTEWVKFVARASDWCSRHW